MGLQPVFELTTAGGRKIQITGNHPYLVRDSGLTDKNRQNIAGRRLQTLAAKGVNLAELTEGREFAGPTTVWKVL